MLHGFEQITFELTEKELEVLPFIVGSLKKKTKETPVTNRQIVEGLKKNLDYKTNEPRVRKIISYIRIKGILTNLVGDVTGYYCTQDQKELDKWVDQMKLRALNIWAAAHAAKIPDDGQTKLFPEVEAKSTTVDNFIHH